MIVSGGSHARLRETTIIRNAHAGSGVLILDSSSVEAFPGELALLQVSGNSGWGIECGPAPQVPQLTGGAFGPSTVFGNGLGQISCPGF